MPFENIEGIAVSEIPNKIFTKSECCFNFYQHEMESIEL